MLTLYDTASRQKVPFKSLEPDKVRIYSCGPTIYDFAHIGNFRSFMFADILKRYLCYRGFEVFHVMNLTDVDDRIAARVRDEGIPLRELTDRFAQQFFDDLKVLNVTPADRYPRATDHIAEMVELTQKLLDKGIAYNRDGSVYYSIAKFPSYGEFARLDIDGMQDGARVDSDDYDKNNVRDFVLWKGWTEKDGDVAWDSPFGRGRPGWHLECSAMSKKYLGEEFDIHTGGVDLVFPHHQNEIAQSEGVSGKPFVRQWMHNAFLNINGTKLSKRLGNHIRVRDIGSFEEICGFRFLVATSHYRTVLNYSEEVINASVSALKRLRRVRDRVNDSEDSAPNPDSVWQERIGLARSNFEEGMDDDLNCPKAIAAVFGLIHHVEKNLAHGDLSPKNARAVAVYLEEIDSVLGIFYDSEGADEGKHGRDLSNELQDLFERRLKAREDKDWDLADQLRDELDAAGVVVQDGQEGSTWQWK